MHKIRLLSVLIVAAIVISIWAMSAAASDEIGSIVSVSGDAKIGRGGATLNATSGMPIRVHDQLSTSPDGSLTLGFPDGTSLSLAGATAISIDDSSAVDGKPAPSRVTLLRGKLHTNVPDKTTGATHTIEIDTPDVRAVAPAAEH
ncbi:MAG: FecR domain-containing protein [Candidatus Binatus sp.]|uniref:FecR domain-containing protein n=1 Tax=Candidatus Binatus sp. TaxID=2811406 RepID=UPI00271D3E04|nr:FecR domain-containing protein [Candidatus Binatus sp.]MDO8431916.1 FecR domain-containing protein [Candidatus Binatus sp.]